MSITLYEMILRIVLAMVLSGIIGYEREHIGKAAGFRTHILVCLGSTTVMLCSILIFNEFHAYTTMDPTRLAASVVSGIGFLGAGTIIREGVNIKGLTTAASIWAVACVGLAIGNGYYGLGVLATVFIFLTLRVFGYLENNNIIVKDDYQFTIEYDHQFNINNLLKYLSENQIQMLKYSSKKNSLVLSLSFDEHDVYLKLLDKLTHDENIQFINSLQIK